MVRDGRDEEKSVTRRGLAISFLGWVAKRYGLGIAFQNNQEAKDGS